MDSLYKVAELIKNSKKTIVFTGAGISVESGIPPFRGDNGLWDKYDPILLDINYYQNNPKSSWPIIKKLFYDFIKNAKPNNAHYILSEWEKEGFVNSIITQNIDNLHQLAGSKNVLELHGTTDSLVCTKCRTEYKRKEIEITDQIPICLKDTCKSLLKPNFVFFGEGLPTFVYSNCMDLINTSEVLLIIGTTGEVMPANQIPIMAKNNGVKIIEINTKPSLYTNDITDILLQGKASEILHKLQNKIKFLLTK